MTVEGPNGFFDVDTFFSDDQFAITDPGVYTLTIDGDTDLVEAYEFELVAVPDAETFQISLGDSVSDGVPAVGAGNIESQGAADVYEFTVPVGVTMLDFDAVSPTFDSRYQVTIEGPNGFESIDTFFRDRTVAITDPGAYTLTVEGDTDLVSTYSFTLTGLS